MKHFIYVMQGEDTFQGLVRKRETLKSHYKHHSYSQISGLTGEILFLHNSCYVHICCCWML